MKVKSESEVAQACPTLSDPMDRSLPGSSAHGIFQASTGVGCHCLLRGITVELFQILKDDAVKVVHSICQKICKSQQWPRDWKWSVFIPIPKKDNAKSSNNCTIALISHASKVNAENSLSKASHKPRTSRCSGGIFKKAEEPEIKLPISMG